MKWTWVTLPLSLLIAASAYCAPDEADQVEARARASFIQEFSKFTQDKNIQGRAKNPDGSPAQGGPKTRFNADDGLPFQSDITYHDFAYTSFEEEPTGQNDANGNPQTKTKTLLPFISNHGKVSAAGGSSLLERTVYGLAEQLTEQDRNNKDAQNEEEGVRNESIYRITTKEVFEGNTPEDASKNAADNNAESEKEKVNRYELRQEVAQEVTKVGEGSAETILQAARGEQAQNDPQALGQGVLLRQAAYDATRALWMSTLGNRTQRIANRAPRGNLPFSPRLSEGVASCDDWALTAQQEISQQDVSPERQQTLMQELERMKGQCQQLSALPFNAVDPRFEKQEDGEVALQIQGPQKEDAFARDARIQLELMAKAGKSVTEIPANWQFTEQDEKARMVISYDENAPREGELTMREQIESYNANLQDAEAGYSDIQKRFQDLQAARPTDFQIEPGTRHILEINQPPASAFEEVGIQKGVGSEAIPQTYDQLIQSNQASP